MARIGLQRVAYRNGGATVKVRTKKVTPELIAKMRALRDELSSRRAAKPKQH